MVDAVTRVLAEEQEPGRIWVDGAEPGGFAAGGDDIPSAHEALKKMFRDILQDTAEEAKNFSDFETEMRRFFKDVDRRVMEAWMVGWKANQDGDLDIDSVDWMIRARGEENIARLEIREITIPVFQQPSSQQDSGIYRIAA